MLALAHELRREPGVTMKLPVRPAIPRPAQPLRPSGTYLGCTVCGRLLRIQWATRSIVCACGARVTPPPAGGK